MRDFKDLEVWRRSHELTVRLYKISDLFPKSELFGLTSQLRRAASSVEANLAEGCGRTQSEFGRFVQIAVGSNCEVECHLLLARDLGMLAPQHCGALICDVVEIGRMLNGLLKALRGQVAASMR